MVNDIATISRILDDAPEHVNSVDGNGRSALHMAASSGYTAACQTLCEVRNLYLQFSHITSHFFPEPSSPTTPHHHLHGNISCDALPPQSQRGARPDLPDQGGRTPIQAAKEGRHAAAAAIMESAAARTPRVLPVPAASVAAV
jgi:hypothetical protein